MPLHRPRHQRTTFGIQVSLSTEVSGDWIRFARLTQQVLLCAESLLTVVSLGWRVNGLPDTASFRPLRCWGDRLLPLGPVFYRLVGLKLKHAKHFTHWAVPPAPSIELCLQPRPFFKQGLVSLRGPDWPWTCDPPGHLTKSLLRPAGHVNIVFCL